MVGMASEPQVLVGQGPFLWTGRNPSRASFSQAWAHCHRFPSFSPIFGLTKQSLAWKGGEGGQATP